jgi:hypothetical protein
MTFPEELMMIGKKLAWALVALVTLSGSCSPQPSGSGVLEVEATPVAFHAIAYPSGYDVTSEGASSYANSGDHVDSAYFAHPDYFNLTSSDGLTVITGFETYQQTTEWSCAPASALMVLHYYGDDSTDEMSIAELMGTTGGGASPKNVVAAFESLGYLVEASPTGLGEDDGATFDDPENFRSWAVDNLKNGTPTLLNWVDWAGHWQVLVGYDTMGTKEFGDDVLIVADPYDTSDHLQDGYMALPAERFFYMWRSGDGIDTQPWVIAKPAK